jgi:hypothetical protein
MEVKVQGRVKFNCATSLNRGAETIHRIRHEECRFVYKASGTYSYKRRGGWEKVWEPRIEVTLKFLCSSDVARSPNLRFLSKKDADAWVDGSYWAVIERLGPRRWCPMCEQVDGWEGYSR